MHYVALIISGGSESKTTGISWADWADALSMTSAEEFTWFKIAQIMVIIAVVLAGIILVAAIIQLFFRHKAIDLVAKIAGIVLIVVSILVLVFSILGTIATL